MLWSGHERASYEHLYRMLTFYDALRGDLLQYTQHNFPNAVPSCQKVEEFLKEHEENAHRATCCPAVALISTPCQGFSTANRGGKNDTENNEQVSSVGHILKFIQPPFVVYENVSSSLLHYLSSQFFLYNPSDFSLLKLAGSWVCTSLDFKRALSSVFGIETNFWQTTSPEEAQAIS